MKYDKDGIDFNTKNILFSDNNIYLEKEWQNQEKLKILCAIDIYTQIVHKNIVKRLLRKTLARRLGVDLSNIRYDKETKKHEFVLSNSEKITFDVLSEHLEEPSKDIIKELESKKRHGKCHNRSVDSGNSLKDSIIQTGTIIVGNRKVLHSVVEIKNRTGNDIIIDWTRNLVIDKEKYIKLFNFNILSSIKSEDVQRDSEYIKYLPCFGLKAYLTFRDELITNIDKNKFLFEQSESCKVKTKRI